MSTITLVCLTYNLQGILPYYTKPTRSSFETTSTRTIQLMHMNIFAPNRKKSDIIKAIHSRKPDIIDFVEYTPQWQKQLETPNFLKQYPYHMSGRAHVAIYSKFPIQSSQLFYSIPSRRIANHANLLVQLSIEGETLSVLVVHPPVAFNKRASEENKAAFALWEKRRNSFGNNLIIVGDFNTTPWSPQFQQLLQHTDLRDSAVGFGGIQPTWPMFFAPLGPKGRFHDFNLVLKSNLLRIPIDHALVSPTIHIQNRLTGPDIGSDHLPLSLTFSIQKNPLSK